MNENGNKRNERNQRKLFGEGENIQGWELKRRKRKEWKKWRKQRQEKDLRKGQKKSAKQINTKERWKTKPDSNSSLHPWSFSFRKPKKKGDRKNKHFSFYSLHPKKNNSNKSTTTATHYNSFILYNAHADNTGFSLFVSPFLLLFQLSSLIYFLLPYQCLSFILSFFYFHSHFLASCIFPLHTAPTSLLDPIAPLLSLPLFLRSPFVPLPATFPSFWYNMYRWWCCVYSFPLMLRVKGRLNVKGSEEKQKEKAEEGNGMQFVV